MNKTKKVLQLLLSVILVLSFGSMAALAVDYDLQGTGGNQLKMVRPADIADTTGDSAAYYSNVIHTELDPTADIVFTYTVTSGMNNFDETLFTETNLPQIGVYDTYGGHKVADPVFVEKTGEGISISIPAGTLTDGTYVLVFGKDIQGNNSSKILGMDIAFTFTATTGAAPQTNPLTDVPAWAQAYVDTVVANGCMQRVDATTFNPGGTVTRGEFVTILGMARGIKTANFATSTFTDVDDTDVCSPYAAWASSKNITNGIGDGAFGPDDILTRQQAITMLYRYAMAFSMDTAAEGDVGVFSDSAQVSAWAETAMQWAVGHQYVGGMGNGIIAPAAFASRAQIAKLIAVLVLA